MAKLYFTLLWHYHQPYYMDRAAGHSPMPWVRLHGIKAYTGMAHLLAEFPELRQVINFVPSLVRQIQEYAQGATDRALLLARTPADSLSEEQAVEILNTFFRANREHMIDPHPRYHQLLARRETGIRPVEQIAREFSPQDFLDLQVWSNLAWFHPTVVEKDADLAALMKKGTGFTENEKQLVLDRQLEVLAGIIPMHRRLAESGQLELTTSPFYHALVPLLCDPAVARAARPDLPLPMPMLTSSEDAVAQVERAVAFHERTFGSRPRGLWPSEGAVSDDAAAVFANAGLEWIATDEEILEQTIGVRFARDGAGVVNRPDVLYRPYRLACNRHHLAVIFRDHVLSDGIGFRYHLQEPQAAAKDLVARLEAIRCAAPDNALVVVALDGENCWEHYPNQGVEFLRHLYRLLVEAPFIETIRISDYLDQFAPAANLDTVFAGSWVHHSFASWMGGLEKNRAWEHLARARDFYTDTVASGRVSEKDAEAALEQLYIAEGSDWFWWYGGDEAGHTDAQFDELFRRHVRRVYELLGAWPRDELLAPVSDEPVRESWTLPRKPLDVRVDGRRTTFFEWLGAGRYDQARDAGPAQAEAPVATMFFGSDADRFFLRLDLPAPTAGKDRDLTVELWLGGADEPTLTVRFGPETTEVHAKETAGEPIEAAWERVLEIAVPWSHLGLTPDPAAEFSLRLLASGRAVQRIPAAGSIPLRRITESESADAAAEDLV